VLNIIIVHAYNIINELGGGRVHAACCLWKSILWRATAVAYTYVLLLCRPLCDRIRGREGFAYCWYSLFLFRFKRLNTTVYNSLVHTSTVICTLQFYAYAYYTYLYTVCDNVLLLYIIIRTCVRVFVWVIARIPFKVVYYILHVVFVYSWLG